MTVATVTTSHAALSATTANTIQGTKPYLSTTLTNVIQTEGNFELFGLSDGTNSYYTQSDIDTYLLSGLNLQPMLNNPIDITSSLNLSLGTPNATEALDADGDVFSPIDEKTAGSVTLNWYRAGSNTQLTAAQLSQTFCQLAARGIIPELRASGAVTLKTTYGDPRIQDYPDAAIGVTQTPKRVFDHGKAFDLGANTVCYAKPDMSYATGNYAGPANMWDEDNGFIPQSILPAGYGNNFPTTGADGLYFYLIVTGVDATTLSWLPVTSGNVTATPNVTNANTVKITLSGPKAIAPAALPTNPYADGATALLFTPSTFVLEGKDASNNVKASYGFALRKWYINRGDKRSPAVAGSWVNPDGISYINQNSWCNGLNGGNYVLAKVKDLTNSNVGPAAKPSNPNGNFYKRYIGGGLFSEWGRMDIYTGVGFNGYWYWTGDTTDVFQFLVSLHVGNVVSLFPNGSYNGVCTQP